MLTDFVCWLVEPGTPSSSSLYCLQVASATPSSASAFAKAPTGSHRWVFSWRPRIETRPPVWRSGRSSTCRGDVWVQNGCRDETITEFVLQREHGHYYGYVYFRQVRDKSLKRGYFQKVSLISSWHTHTFTVHISNFVFIAYRLKLLLFSDVAFSVKIVKFCRFNVWFTHLLFWNDVQSKYPNRTCRFD